MATEDPLLTAIVALADFYCSSHVTSDSVAQASIPGPSEESAWHLFTQHAPDQSASGLEHFLSNLDEEYEAIGQEVDVLFNTMTT